LNDRFCAPLTPSIVTAGAVSGRTQKKPEEKRDMTINTTKNQIVLRDIPAGMPVKTRVRGGLKLDGIKG
jgi:hypothetical protein